MNKRIDLPVLSNGLAQVLANKERILGADGANYPVKGVACADRVVLLTGRAWE
jgi:hypothetical protein